jgi:hypothetical protein
MRGGFDIDTILRRAARRGTLLGGGARVVIATERPDGLIENVRPETWTAFRRELPRLYFIEVVSPKNGVEGKIIPQGKYPATIRLADNTEESPAQKIEMPSASRWAAGARAWRLWLEMERDPFAADSLRLQALASAKESGVLTPIASYIVVENTLQWKMLALKERQTKSGAAWLDTVESDDPIAAPAPGFLLLAAPFALFLLARRLRASNKIRE